MAAKYNIAGANGRVQGYDPYPDIDKIYSLKGQWEDAIGDADKQNAIAKKAQEFYAPLRQNGYGDVADELTAKNHQQSKFVRDAYAKLGKTATRPYLKTLGKKYGMSDSDVDKIITYDNTTGEVGLGGINLGKPDSVTGDGVSYWNDTAKLDNAFDQYARNAGLSTPAQVKWNDTFDTASGELATQNENVRAFQTLGLDAGEEALDQLKAYNKESRTPTTSSEDYKRVWSDVMPGYEYEADKVGYNAAASGASTNGGNVDSYAAANARRQREASLAKGQQLAAQLGIAARQNTMDTMMAGAQEGRSLMGAASDSANKSSYDAAAAVNNFRNLLEETRSERTDTASRELTKAQTEYTQAQADDLYGQITGQATMRSLAKLYPGYMNPDGTFKDSVTETDFKAIIDDLEANNSNGQNTALINSLKQMRYAKGMNVPGHSQYLSSGSASPMPYNRNIEADKDRAEARHAVDVNAETARYQADTEKAMNDSNNDTTLAVTNANNQNALDQLGFATQNGGSGTAFTTNEIDVNKAVTDINNIIKNEYGLSNAIIGNEATGYSITSSDEKARTYVAFAVFDSELTAEQMEYLLTQLGYTEEEIGRLAQQKSERDYLKDGLDANTTITKLVQPKYSTEPISPQPVIISKILPPISDTESIAIE